MKTLVAICIIALATSFSFAQKTTAPKQVLHDFRTTGNVQSTKISASVQKSVLSKVFRRYLTDARRCNPNFSPEGTDDFLKAARNAGQIAPSIIDSATGSFTAPGQLQTAYLISVSECGASHADNFGSDRVAIFNGQQLVADFDADFKSSFLRKLDLDGDGIEELLMSSGYMNQGILTESAALVNFKAGKWNVIEDFGPVNEDACASGFPGASIKTSVISYPGIFTASMPKLQQENYEASCKTPKRWKLVGRGKWEQ
jgi:hypothetical protein